MGLWGPAARSILGSVSADDLSNEAFPYYTAQAIELGAAPVFAMRMSYVGELGFEIYVASEYALHVWDRIWEAGQAHGLVAGGTGAMDSLRIEKGYRRLAFDIHGDHDPFEAGLSFAVRMKKPSFVGRSALAERRAQPSGRKLACFTLDEQSAVVLGREPILVGDQRVGFVSSANTGYSVGRHIGYGYLPSELAQPGQALAVEYFGERLPATVAAEPLFDPGGTRLKI